MHCDQIDSTLMSLHNLFFLSTQEIYCVTENSIELGVEIHETFTKKNKANLDKGKYDKDPGLSNVTEITEIDSILLPFPGYIVLSFCQPCMIFRYIEKDEFLPI